MPTALTFVFMVCQILQHQESGCVFEGQALSDALVVGVKEDTVDDPLLSNLLVEALHGERPTEKTRPVNNQLLSACRAIWHKF